MTKRVIKPNEINLNRWQNCLIRSVSISSKWRRVKRKNRLLGPFRTFSTIVSVPTHRHDGGTWGAGEVFDHLPIGLPRGRVGRSRGVGGVRLGGGRGRGLGSGWIEEQLDPRLPAFVSCHVLSKARPSPRASHGSGHGSGRHLALYRKKRKNESYSFPSFYVSF